MTVAGQKSRDWMERAEAVVINDYKRCKTSSDHTSDVTHEERDDTEYREECMTVTLNLAEG